MFGKKVRNYNELEIPPIAAADSNGSEISRAWIANGGLHVSLRPETWKDSATWGIAIADIIRHLADAYRVTQAVEPAVTIDRILGLVHAEFDSPTDIPTGEFVD